MRWRSVRGRWIAPSRLMAPWVSPTSSDLFMRGRMFARSTWRTAQMRFCVVRSCNASLQETRNCRRLGGAAGFVGHALLLLCALAERTLNEEGNHANEG